LTPRNVLSVAAYAVIYYAFFKFNLLIFDQFTYSYGVHWIFIPSGIQLVLVLSAMESAAMGIVIASWFMGYESFFTGSLLFTFVTGWIAGLSPLIARKIALDFLHIEEDLGNLTFKGIVQTSIIFALISATLHQLWYYYTEVSEMFVENFFVMAVGNLLGTLIVLTLIKLMLKILKLKDSSNA
jgi:hypothetical protein